MSCESRRKQRLSEIGRKIAGLIDLHGIMDVEVIDDGEDLKVLEIDARIPSQTPIAVLYSSGMNELAELADITISGNFTKPQTDLGRYSAYEHYKREDGRIVQEGEHMMGRRRTPAGIGGFLRKQDCHYRPLRR